MTKKKLQGCSILLFLLLSILAACGSQSESTPAFALVTRQSSTSVTRNELKTVTAHCLPGETALGGGYSTSSDDDNSSLVIEGSYPDGVPTPTADTTTVNPNGWSLNVFASGDNGKVVVEAYCLAASSPNITLQLSFEEYPNEMYLEATPGRPEGPYALCPAGTTTLSGGFEVSLADQQKASLWNAGIAGSEPHLDTKTGLADGWSVSLTAYDALKGVNAFALCATSASIQPAKVVTASAIPLVQGTTQSLSKMVGTTTCGTNQFSVGGGFQMSFYSPSALTSPRRITVNLDGGGITNDFSVVNWTAAGNAGHDVQLSTSVACLNLPSRSAFSAA